MARRAIAVTLVCLLTAPPPAAHAQPSTTCAAGPLRAQTRGVEPFAPGRGEVEEMLGDLRRRLGEVRPGTQITVPTRVHVLTDGRRRAPDSAIRGQLATLNAAYSGRFGGVDTGVRFRLDEITVKKNARWFGDPLTYETSMKGALRRGGPETLNLYVAQLSELVLGYSTYPYWYEGSPSLDGVVIDWRSLPGGALRDFDQGYTGVHEIGHWLGLFHTFENGCDTPGDGVADTPAEGQPTEGCPPAKDTCPAPGPDPIHNFMDYAHDRCMSEFTRGQSVRMHEMWAAYRETNPDI